MKVDAERQIVFVHVELTAGEANNLYNELYRLNGHMYIGDNDRMAEMFPGLSMLWDQIRNVGVDGTR